MTMVRVAWLGLGSNLQNPAQHIRRAIIDLDAQHGLRLLAISPLYRTTPVGGPSGQPQYCNACVAVACKLTPLALLDGLHAIEAAHGRARDVRWGPRTLDLDILACDDMRMRHERLILPHPRAAERGFVLVPLADIAPALTLAGERVIDLVNRVDTSGVQRWQEMS